MWCLAKGIARDRKGSCGDRAARCRKHPTGHLSAEVLQKRRGAAAPGRLQVVESGLELGAPGERRLGFSKDWEILLETWEYEVEENI